MQAYPTRRSMLKGSPVGCYHHLSSSCYLVLLSRQAIHSSKTSRQLHCCCQLNRPESTGLWTAPSNSATACNTRKPARFRSLQSPTIPAWQRSGTSRMKCQRLTICHRGCHEYRVYPTVRSYGAYV